jgi:hypothetical protein
MTKHLIHNNNIKDFILIFFYCEMSDGDVKVSKHVAVYITQTDCCDIYCYGICCKLSDGDRKVSKHVAV